MEYLKLKWPEIVNLCYGLREKIKDEDFDIFIGISRGGLVPVRLLADMLDEYNVDVVKVELYTDIGERADRPIITIPLTKEVKGKRVLLVDDIADSGLSSKAAVEHVQSCGAKDVKLACLMTKPTSIIEPDYYVEATDKWVIFPWEFHETLRKLKQRLGPEEYTKELEKTTIDLKCGEPHVRNDKESS